MIKTYKLYTGDDGHSYFKQGYVEENILTEAVSIRFKETPAGFVYDMHTAPTTQYVICLSGTLEFKMHSGDTFLFSPGEILIAMDTTGSGHSWKIMGDQPWRRAYVAFSEGTIINFVDDSKEGQHP